jgi:predicted nucleic acid-binding protein
LAAILVHRRDSKDSKYVELAIAAGAHGSTSRDRHLLALTDPTDPIGIDFKSRFALIEVLTPIQLLQRVRNTGYPAR